MAKTIHFQCQTSPRAGKPSILPIFVCNWSPSFLVIKNSNLIFAKILPERPLRPYLWSQLSLTAKMAHFQGQMSPRAGKPPILLIFVFYSLQIFWWSGIPTSFLPKFYLDVRQYFTYGDNWPSIAKQSIFKVKWALEQVNPPFYQFSCGIVLRLLVIRNSDLIFTINFLLIRNSDLIFANILPGRLLRLYLWG